MPIFQLGEELIFPPANLASEDGVLAVGGEPSPERLLLAYSQGIFPWPHEEYPLLWFSPDPRFVLEPASAIIGRSLQKSIRRGRYDIRADTAFREVMLRCAKQKRPGQRGTWITPEMIEGYCALHDRGIAHSIEAYEQEQLVGGLYGVSLGGIYFGESMFADAEDASKVAFATLLAQLQEWRFDLVDCQSYTDHLARFGAVHWPRQRFLRTLETSLQKATRKGPWALTVSLATSQSKR